MILLKFQCASIFTEIITDVDKTRDLIVKNDFKEPSSVSSNTNPGPRNQSGSPKKDQTKKRLNVDASARDPGPKRKVDAKNKRRKGRLPDVNADGAMHEYVAVYLSIFALIFQRGFKF